MTVHSPVHWLLDAVKSSCTLSTSVLHCGDDRVVWGILSISPHPNTAARADAKELDFGFT